MNPPKRLALILMLYAGCSALQGCLMRDASGGDSYGFISFVATINIYGDVNCVLDVEKRLVTCTPVIAFGSGSQPTASFSYGVDLFQYDLLAHYLLFRDPLIVQVPAGSNNFDARIVYGPPGVPSNTPLSITAGLTSIPIDVNTNLVAEPGMQLVIIDFQHP